MKSSPTKYGWRAGNLTYSAAYLAPQVVSLLAEFCLKKVADLGTGNGANLKAWDGPGRTIVGIEPDAEGCAIAARENPKIKLYQLGVNEESLSIVEAPFDAVVSLEVIEHVFDSPALPVFARQLLKPGGILVISTPYHGYLKNLGLALAGAWDHHHHPQRVGGHIKFWSRATLTKLLQDNGFEVIRFIGAGRAPYLWKSMILVAKAL